MSAAQIPALIGPKTKAIIINSPNNPTGLLYPDAVIEELVQVARLNNLFLIFDECYGGLRYPDVPRRRLGDILGDYPRAIIVDSFSKLWSLTGWRIGFVCAPPEVIRVVGSIQTHTASNPNSIAQYAVLWTLQAGGVNDHVQEVIRHLRQNRDHVVNRLGDIPQIHVPRSEGGFFAYVNVKDVLAQNGAMQIDDLCAALLRNRGVLVVPGTAFGDPNGFRLSFSGRADVLCEGLDRLAAFFAGGNDELACA